MARKPQTTEAKKPAAATEKKEGAPKAHAAKPGINPFVQQHPGKPGKTAAGGNLNSRRNTR